MSCINETFFTNENVGVDELNTKLPDLNRQLETYRTEVSLYLDTVEKKLEEQPKRNRDHISTLTRIKNELVPVKSTLNDSLNEELARVDKNYDELVDEFNEVTYSISIVHVLCELHERVAALRMLCTNFTDYSKVVDLVEVLNVLVHTLSSNPNVPLVEEFRRIVNNEISHVNSLFTQEFKKYCVMNKSNDTSMLRVPQNVDILNTLLPAIYKNDSNAEHLHCLSNYVWDELFLRVIKLSSKIIIEKHDCNCILRVKRNGSKTHYTYEDIYENIILIDNFLIEWLNCKLNDELTLLNYIATSEKKALAKTMLIESVSKSVPTEWNAWDKFKTAFINSTKEFKKKVRIQSLFDDQWDCFDEIREFYKENRSKYYNDKAKEIMKKDLHNFVEVGTPYNPQTSLVESDLILRCSISSNILELIKLGEELINEILDGPAENIKTLLIAYKGIFFNYGDFVAAYHQKLLETIPQQVALFFNNCNYLYQQLQKWDEMFEDQAIFSEVYDISFKEFHQVEEVGRMFFNSFVDEQKTQIRCILKETNIQNKKTLDKIPENTEKLIRQCLRQQELLKTVWSKVLSYTVYNQIVGEILNSLCNFLNSSLVAVEDIEAVVAENLIEIFKIILNRGPKLFSDPNEIYIYVPEWYKFNELVFILGASLLDINDRWADGKGPLALQFKPYEIKQLIRALFQNTERRAMVLNKIHE